MIFLTEIIRKDGDVHPGPDIEAQTWIEAQELLDRLPRGDVPIKSVTVIGILDQERGRTIPRYWGEERL